VLGEIKSGYQGGSQLGRNEVILLPDLETAEQYARIFAQLKRAGTPVPANDLWIAAIVLQHNLRLITRDGHFERIPQLLLL
jgi:tRNA(fMet)-specific endonuclease VapC